MLRALIPAVNIIAVLSNPDNPSSGAQLKSEQEAADKLGVQLLVFGASNESDIDSAFARLAAQRAGALIVNSDGYLGNRREQIISLARRHLIPTIYEFRDAAADGGLLSYGASIVDAWRQAAGYVARILRGEKPADLPVMQPTRFELVINLTTAKALGLDVPPTVLALADEVIE